MGHASGNDYPAPNLLGSRVIWLREPLEVRADGQTQIKLSLNISGDSGVIAGPIVDLVDNIGKWAQFYWYGQTAGNDVLTASFSALPAPDYITAGFNFGDIQHIHLECDPGSFAGVYDLQFQNRSEEHTSELQSLRHLV